ncbi:MAG: hypothetical protein KAU31_15625 [Spirochaetaceae bacterium]|nr:hypothetical protein [Spirochaetaceae bacterium]
MDERRPVTILNKQSLEILLSAVPAMVGHNLVWNACGRQQDRDSVGRFTALANQLPD